MIGDTATCALETCDNEFTKVTHNQKFCTNDCCKIKTNANIIAQYHEKVAIKKGKKRWCTSCGKTALSRYNSTGTCSLCQQEKKNEHLGEAKMLVSQVIWL